MQQDAIRPVLEQAHQTLNLNGTWSVTALPLDVAGKEGYRAFAHGSEEVLAAQVPGEIHLDLMNAGRMSDPSVSDNARKEGRWPEKNSWWYRTEFSPPPGFRENWRQRLIFDGIDLYGQIFVNGKLAGETRNAFATVDLDVKNLLKNGINELVVRVTSGMELAPPPTADLASMTPEMLDYFSARSFISEKVRVLRKAAYSTYGWDWCDALPNIGLWRGVRLEGRSHVVIDHLRLDTAIRGNKVTLEGQVVLENLHAYSEIPVVLQLHVTPPQGEPIIQNFKVDARVGRSALDCSIVIPNPQLWWPNGMGEQPLYLLTARILCEGRETDVQVQTLGLRTIELDRSPLPEGSRFCFKVNGQDVYCKGGNWAPADLIPARIDSAHCQKLVAEAKNAHFTMLRVNGVGIYESDDFYDACDRAGILVWQDFTFSCAQYPDRDPAFLELVRNEARSVVRRLRQHTSLAFWCGNNENIWFMQTLWKCGGVNEEECGGMRIYNEILPDVCRFYDPARPYWPGSPFGGVDPNGELSGDTHWWGQGPGENPLVDLSQQAVDECRGRFVSEYGAIGPPHLASVRQFLKPTELSLDSAAWKIHTNMCAKNAIVPGIREYYGDPEALSLAQYVLYGQMFQALLQGRIVDGMRFRKNDPRDDCQGLLVWSYNDAWGETGWSIIDHYARRKASYYWFRRSAAPVKVLVRSRAGHLVTRVVNDTLDSYQAVVRCGWVRLDGSATELRDYPITIPANGMIEVTRTTLPSASQRDAREWLFAATLTGKGIAQDQAIWLLAPHRELALEEPSISTTIQNGILQVSSSVYCHGVHLEDEGAEVLGDNYFDLLPGVTLRIPITTPTPSGTYPLEAVMPITATGARTSVKTKRND